MNIEQIHLQSFRNYNESSFSFEPNAIHCLIGKNAQGKTNLIESIYFLSHLHSFRTRQMSDLIQDGKEWMRLQAKVETHGHKEEIKVMINEHQRLLFHHQNPVKKYSDFVGIVNAILFCPDDMLLFKQSPRYRRRLIDMEMVKISKTYTNTLSHYQKVLKERNALLKHKQPDLIYLQILTDQLIDDQLIIMKQRDGFVKRLQKEIVHVYPFFFEEKETIDLQYQTFVSLQKDLKEEMKQLYQQTLPKDLKYQQTTLGIHKDDLCFLYHQKPMSQAASQGQKRSFLLALKLGLAQLIHQTQQEYPILLLDDVFSELDRQRQRQLIEHLPEA
ncbi:MAG: DNA replication and repair protein RecF, partial [Erysipelotrichaceae bacterium]|nr:DNA replication and repair protein RecF [Erysipelotrichaceae bacterium]